MCSQSSLEQSIRHFLVPKWELQIQLTTNRLIHKPSIDEGWVEPAQTTFSANKMSQVKAAVGFSSFAQEIISICRLKCWHLLRWHLRSASKHLRRKSRGGSCESFKVELYKSLVEMEKSCACYFYKECCCTCWTGQQTCSKPTTATVLSYQPGRCPLQQKGARILLGKDILKYHSFLLHGDCKAMMQRLILLNPDLWT